ncbi:RDD family protein [Hyphomonas sp.]|uniref:RDD family protein n=1 Tax=Hyphomonas sp. TaxID=87 RepID=UPI0039192A5C
MATFGKQVSTGGPAAKPAFGKKSAPSPMGRAAPAAREQLSPQALAFLQSERSRAPEPAPKPGAPRAASIPAYAASSSAVNPYAGQPVWGRRIIALLIDSLIVGLPVFFFFGLGIFGAAAAAPTDNAAFIAVLTFSVILGVCSIIYSVSMEASKKQATWGKLAVGAIVTDTSGGKPTLGAVILRNTAGRFCSNVIPFYIGYFIGLGRADRRCIHDLIAGTMVRKRAADGGPASYGDVFA